jgi:hypothetical protein
MHRREVREGFIEWSTVSVHSPPGDEGGVRER